MFPEPFKHLTQDVSWSRKYRRDCLPSPSKCFSRTDNMETPGGTKRVLSEEEGHTWPALVLFSVPSRVVWPEQRFSREVLGAVAAARTRQGGRRPSRRPGPLSQNGGSGPRGPFRFPLRCEPRKMFTSRKCPSVHSPIPCPPPLTPEHLPGFDKRLRRTLGFESRGAASERRADVCLKVTCRSPCQRSAGRETATTPESPGTPELPGTVSVRERTSLQPCRTPGGGWGLCLAVEKHPAPV